MWWILAIFAIAVLATLKYYTAFEIQGLVKRIESLRGGRRGDKQRLKRAREHFRTVQEEEKVSHFRLERDKGSRRRPAGPT